jgi:hypothetical protein
MKVATKLPKCSCPSDIDFKRKRVNDFKPPAVAGGFLQYIIFP